MYKRKLRILIAKPRGFCAGVIRAVEIVDRALEKYGPPVYVRHEIVHNKHVVDTLSKKGVIFVENIDEIPEGAITIFSAHGVSRKIVDQSKHFGLKVIDATCPLVSKVHSEIKHHSRRGYEVILIGHEGHPEVEGTMGQIPNGIHLVSDLEDVKNVNPTNPLKVAYVTQTTLSVDDTREIIEMLRDRFPDIIGPDLRDICYATQNRQSAVKKMTAESDVIIVIGADNSSNSNRLQELGEQNGIPSYLISEASKLDIDWLKSAKTVGVTSGASAPEVLVKGLIDRLETLFEVTIEEMAGIEENVVFNLPQELAKSSTRTHVSKRRLKQPMLN